MFEPASAGMLEMGITSFLPEKRGSPEKPLSISFNQACNLYEWSQIYNRRPETGTLKEADKIQTDFRNDPLINQMKNWELRYLSEEEFWKLVCLQNSDTAKLFQQNASRAMKDMVLKLREIRFLIQDNTYLSRISKLKHFPNSLSAPFFTPVFIRQTVGDDEQKNGELYLHDGNVRLMGYASYLLESGQQYIPIPAVVGTKDGHSNTDVLNQKKPLIVNGFQERNPVPQQEIYNTFQNAEQLYFVTPDKIGDTIVGTGFIKSIVEFEKVYNLPPKEKILMAPLSMHKLLEPLCRKYNIKIMQAPPGTGTNRAEYQAATIHHKKAVIFELDALGGGDPEGLYFGEGQLTIRNMLPSIVERYSIGEAGVDRNKKYLADLFGVETSNLDFRACQPCFEMETGDRNAIKEIINKYNIDLTKPQVCISIETSEPGRSYSLDNWCWVVSLIKAFHPQCEFNIIFDPNKKPQDESYIDRDLLKQKITQAASIGGKSPVHFITEPLPKLVQFARTQNVIIGNDSGIPHLIATASLNGEIINDMPNVVTLFAAPHAKPEYWATSPRMKPIIPPKDASQDADGGIYCTNEKQKWINKIEPSQVVGCALAAWTNRNDQAQTHKLLRRLNLKNIGS